MQVIASDDRRWDVERARRQLEDEGLTPHAWGNGPGDRYGWHRHDYHKVLYCVAGSIVFHTGDGDVELGPGDRLELSPGTDHAATVVPKASSASRRPGRPLTARPQV